MKNVSDDKQYKNSNSSWSRYHFNEPTVQKQ